MLFTQGLSIQKRLEADAIATHEKITNFMIARGFYHPHDLSEQLQVDLTVSDTALKLAKK